MTRFSLFTLLSVLLLSMATVSIADIGPKPTMRFSFEMAEGLQATSGQLLESSNPDGSEAKPLAQVGPQRFRVDPKGAFAMAYGFADYHRLEITFSDGKTRRSNVFKTKGMKSTYTVEVRANDLVVK